MLASSEKNSLLISISLSTLRCLQKAVSCCHVMNPCLCLPSLDGTPSGHSRHFIVNLSSGYGIFYQVYVLFSRLHCPLTSISSLSKMSTSTDEGSDNLSNGLPLARLTTFLRDAISSSELDNPIIIPEDLAQAISQLPLLISSADVQAIVLTLDGENNRTLARLDDRSLWCIAHVLLNAESSLAQERGLFLLLDTLEQLTDASRGTGARSKSNAHKRKSFLGQRIIQPLLERFVDDRLDPRQRRLSGQLLLELLRKSEANMELFALGPEGPRRSLGSVLVHERDLTLRFVVADIIRQMTASNFDGEIFWTADDVDQHVRFFKHLKKVNSDWVEVLCSYIHEVDMSRSSHPKTRLIFPYIVESLVIGGKTYSGDKSIGMTVSDCLTFILPTEKPQRQCFQFIDIPLRLMVPKNVYFADKSADERNFYLRLELEPTAYYIMNGEKQFLRDSSINITCYDDATELWRAIERMVLERLGLTVEEGIPAESGISEESQSKPGHMAGAFLSPTNEGDTVSDLSFPNRLVGNLTGNPSRARQIRRGSSAMILLDAPEEVARKSTDYLKSIGAVTEANEFQERALPGTIISGDNTSPQKDCSTINHNLEGMPSWKSDEILHTFSNSDLEGEFPIDEANILQKGTVSQGEKPPAQNDKAKMQEAMADGEDTLPYDALDSQSDPQQQGQPQPQHPDGVDPHPAHAETALDDVPDSFKEPDVSNKGSSAAEHPSAITILDSQDGSMVQGKPAAGDQMPSSGNISEPKSNTQEPLVFSSRLKRPRQKIYGVRTTKKRAPTDWYGDLRDTDNEQEPVSKKKKVKTPRSAPSVSRSKEEKSDSSRKKQPAKPVLPTPKTGSAPQKNRGRVAKCNIPKTLASSRPRRAAAEEANNRISAANDDEDVHDNSPLESIVPEEFSSEHVNLAKNSGPIDCNTGDDASVLVQDEGLPSPPELGSHLSPPKNSVSQSPCPELNDCFVEGAKAEGTEEAPVDLTAVSDSNHADDEEYSHGWEFSDGDATLLEHDQDIKTAEHPKQNNPSNSTQQVQGRGRLMGNKLAEALSGEGIHLPQAASISPRKRSSDRRPIANVVEEPEDLLAVDRREKLSRISQQISEFISQSSAAAAAPPHEVGMIGIRDTDRSSKQAETIPSTTKVIQEKGKRTTGSDKPKKTRQAPLELAEGRGLLGGGLIDERLHRKTQIVSFAVDGPRNQGESYRAVLPKSTTKEPETPARKHRDSLKRKMPIYPDEGQSKGLNDGRRLTPYPKRLRADLASGEKNANECMSSGPSPAQTGFLALSRHPRMFSRGSMVDENGSPRPILRKTRGSQTMAAKGIGKTGFVETSIRNVISQTASTMMPAASESNSQVFTDNDDSGFEVSDDGRGGDSSAVSRIQFPKIHSTQNSPLPLEAQLRKAPNPAIIPTGNAGQPIVEIKKPLSFTQRLEGNGINSAVKSRGLQKKSLLPACNDFPEEMSTQDEQQMESDVEMQTPDRHVASTSALTGSSTLVERDGIEADSRQLRATQKTTLDILFETSKRLMRHFLDEEDAIRDVQETYSAGCRKLIEQLREAHVESIQAYQQQWEPIRTGFIERCQGAVDRLKKNDEVLRTLPSIEKLASAVKKRGRLVTRLEGVMKSYEAKCNAEPDGLQG
ncbi:hypothetical protein VTN02DRAFT_2110 [Thermoascus thermophilus]